MSQCCPMDTYSGRVKLDLQGDEVEIADCSCGDDCQCTCLDCVCPWPDDDDEDERYATLQAETIAAADLDPDWPRIPDRN